MLRPAVVERPQRLRWVWLACALFGAISMGVAHGWAVGLSGGMMLGHLSAIGFAPIRWAAWVRAHPPVVVVFVAASAFFFLAVPPALSEGWSAVGAAGAAVLAVVLLLPDRETRDAATRLAVPDSRGG